MARFLPLLKEEERKYRYCRSCKFNWTLQNKNLDARAKILEDRKKVIDDRKKALEEKKNKSNTT
jgi:hypothetical protein